MEKAALVNESVDISKFRYASFTRRLLALIIDAIILFMAIMLLVIPFSAFDKSIDTSGRVIGSLFQLIFYVIGPVYMVTFLYKYGATPGKMALNLKVVSLKEKKLSIGQLILREVVGKFLSRFLGNLGFLWNLFDEKHQTWHDKIASTVVMDMRPVTVTELAAWKAKQKSYLPHILAVSAIVPIFFTVSIYMLSLTPLLPLIMSFYSGATTILYSLLVLGIIDTVIYLIAAIWLFKKQKSSRFLEGLPTKIGVGTYIGVQILTGISILAIVIYGIIMYVQSPHPHYASSYNDAPHMIKNYPSVSNETY